MSVSKAMPWVSSHRTNGAGYRVRFSVLGLPMGWVHWDGEWWHFYCGAFGCRGHAVDGSKRAAAEQLADHWAIEHR